MSKLQNPWSLLRLTSSGPGRSGLQTCSSGAPNLTLSSLAWYWPSWPAWLPAQEVITVPTLLMP